MNRQKRKVQHFASPFFISFSPGLLWPLNIWVICTSQLFLRFNQTNYMEQTSQQNLFPPAPPKNWLAESILVTIFCCLPFGIVGIVNASQVNSRFASGDYDTALTAFHSAEDLSPADPRTWAGLAITQAAQSFLGDALKLWPLLREQIPELKQPVLLADLWDWPPALIAAAEALNAKLKNS